MKKPVEHNKQLFITCYSRQVVSTQLWGHHQAMNKNWRNETYVENYMCLTESRSVYIGYSTYIWHYMSNGPICRAVYQ
jgi:hypothetical protein